MSFDIRDTHKQTTLQLKECEIELSSWVRDQKSYPGVAAVIIVRSGAMSMQQSISTEQCEYLIEMLHRHIANVKANELELIAAQTKVAA